MPYRQLSGDRFLRVADGLRASAGRTFLLRQQVSAAPTSSGFLGFVPTGLSRQLVFTGQFSPFPVDNTDLGIGGTLPQGDLLGVLPVAPSGSDQIILGGAYYEVQGNPVYSPITQQWVVSLKRGVR